MKKLFFLNSWLSRHTTRYLFCLKKDRFLAVPATFDMKKLHIPRKIPPPMMGINTINKNGENEISAFAVGIVSIEDIFVKTFREKTTLTSLYPPGETGYMLSLPFMTKAT